MWIFAAGLLKLGCLCRMLVNVIGKFSVKTVDDETICFYTCDFTSMIHVS